MLYSDTLSRKEIYSKLEQTIQKPEHHGREYTEDNARDCRNPQRQTKPWIDMHFRASVTWTHEHLADESKIEIE